MKRIVCFFLGLTLLLCGCKEAAGETASSEATAETEGFRVEYPTISSTEPEDPESILAYRRDVVEAAMREQSAILWSPAEDVTYSMVNKSHGIEADREEIPNEVVTLYAGRIYQGIPYTHGSGSYYSWLSFATDRDERGVYTISGLSDQLLTGECTNQINRRARIGNDCADQLFWAWARISGTIRFSSTAFMTENYGVLKVGDYEYTGTRFSKDNNTKDIVANNGQQRMFRAYAQLQKGDGMVLITRSGAGHAVMVVTTNPVYCEDGTIDPEKSYVTVLEQTSGNEANQDYYYHEELGQNVYLCEIMDKEWTYATLFQKGYLPVTCQELVDPGPRPEPRVTDPLTEVNPDTMFTGMIEANYRISSVTMTVTCDGKTVRQAICYGHQAEMYEFNMHRFGKYVEQPVIQGDPDLSDLPPGTYTCTFTAKLSTGDDILFRQLTFTK